MPYKKTLESLIAHDQLLVCLFRSSSVSPLRTANLQHISFRLTTSGKRPEVDYHLVPGGIDQGQSPS